MRALWRLTIKTLAGRPGRTALLVLAVALATVLTVAAAAAIGTIGRSVGHIAGSLAGLSDASVRQRFGGHLPESLLDDIRTWKGVDLACGRVEGSAALRVKGSERTFTAVLRGVEPFGDSQLVPRSFISGRAIRSEGEVTIDPRLRDKLGAAVGDVLEVVRLGGNVELTVVGVFKRPKLGVIQRPTAIAHLDQARALVGQVGRLNDIFIKLDPGMDVESWSESQTARLPAGAMLRTSASVRLGVNRYVRFTRMLLYVLTLLASMSSGFLILTSLTTSVAQQTREMAIFRCLGASRMQLAGAQLGAGAAIAMCGAAVGAPLGLLAAYGLFRWFRGALPAGFEVNPAGICVAISGCLLAGLLGASYPAFLAATANPLEALTLRARRPKNRHVILCAAAGLVLASMQPVAMALPIPGEWVVWFWTYCGLPAAFVGCFLLGAPLLVLIARGAAPVLSGLLGLPRTLLGQSVLATPIRQGFTGGTLMISLALLVSVWTMGRSLSSGWFGSIEMPDAFLFKLPSFTEQERQAVLNTPAAAQVCPTTTFPVGVEGMQFGLEKISPRKTLFVGTDMESFIRMMDLDWREGDPQTALRRMEGGRALLVTREWSVAHGVGAGTTLAIKTLRGPVDFQVVGVIGSKGLEIAVHIFGVRRRFSDTSINSVFGTLADAKRHFGVNNVNLLLVSLQDDIDDAQAVDQLKLAAPGSLAGTSREIRRRASKGFDRMMTVASVLAVGSLILACLGVGNLLVAEVTSRRFEFGVLRAVGGQRALLGRLVAGQTLIVAMVGCVAGTILGLELALIERGFHQRLMGLEYAPRLPWDVIAWGAITVAGAALVAALPAIWWLMRRRPRDLVAVRE